MQDNLNSHLRSSQISCWLAKMVACVTDRLDFFTKVSSYMSGCAQASNWTKVCCANNPDRGFKPW